MENNDNIVRANLWENLKRHSRYVEKQIEPFKRKLTGSYFTELDLTDMIIKELISNLVKENKNIWELKLLEPCVGTGNFIFSYLKEISKFNFEKYKMEILLNNLYVADINNFVLNEYKKMFTEFIKIFFDINLSESYFSTHIGNGLLINVTEDKPHYIKLTDVFPSRIVNDGFDIVITNPPYKNLKAEKGQYLNIADYEVDKLKYIYIKKLVKEFLSYSIDGTLNLYKLFVEEIISNYAKSGAYVNLLIPTSILTDKTCSKLRTYMLLENDIISIKTIPEGSNYINAQQSLSTILLKKGNKTEKISITKDYCKEPKQITEINIDDILDDNTGNAIFALSNQEYNILKQLKKFPTIKDLNFISNFRGELDLTTNKNLIVYENTSYLLLRGKNIGYYKIINLNKNEFVSEEFVNDTKKRKYIEKERIACQQVVNMNKKRRLVFTLIPPKNVLGNSCNFISVADNEKDIDLYALLGLLNTSIVDWFFKLTSSNNHVNNYEIDCFPIPINSSILGRISSLVKEYLETENTKIINIIEKCACQAYGINESETRCQIKNTQGLLDEYYMAIKYVIPDITYKTATDVFEENISIKSIISKLCINYNRILINTAIGITEKFIKLKKGEILNHITFKLSDLDLEMIKSVPQGGSWKDIPQKTIQKSKRLKRISETGGRTTLYGRIDYSKPSYTITTYFNRPGNGTYVHPVQDRVLSVREAARFQGFKDTYYFFGNKTQLLKQVGNALPPILAYQIAKNIIAKTNCKKSIDLFCGAGGITVGFKAAGVQSILSNDIEESACTTIKINNPEIEVFCGDITNKEVKSYIANIAIREKIDLICGGPPCQGFSMAGLRAFNDPRNQLFREFIEIVDRVKPKVIVFENVEGLLSFQNGNLYKTILQMFVDIGYNSEGRTLNANDYGVPQKRKRVIIICTRTDLNLKPADLFPSPIITNPKKQVTAKETIKDLEDVECSESACYMKGEESNIVKLFKDKISYDDYILEQTSFYKSKEEFLI